MFKQLLMVAFLLSLAGVPVLLFLQPPDFGVTPETPMGDPGLIQEWLADKEYDRSEIEPDRCLQDEFGDEVRDCKVVRYDWRNRKEGNAARDISLVFDESGRLWAICARFPSGTPDNRKPEGIPESLIWHLWKRMAFGDEPGFATSNIGGDGEMKQFRRVASFTTGEVTGSWVKTYTQGMRDSSILDWAVLRRAKP